MGQSPSSPTDPPCLSRRDGHKPHRRSNSKPTASISFLPSQPNYEPDFQNKVSMSEIDYISDLPDECLAGIFQYLSSGDRRQCSLVCRQWLIVEGQSRHRLSLNAHADLLPHIRAIFSRFDSVTKLALRCDRRTISLNDDALILISLRCKNLTRLKLRGCRELTDVGLASFSKNCKGLKKLSLGSCTFGSKGINAILSNCSALEELSVKRLRDATDDAAVDPVNPGAAALTLRMICLKELYNGQCFGPLIIAAKKLRTLKLIRCLGDWDRVLEMVDSDREVNTLVEVHLERVQVSDVGLKAISSCNELEILHLVKTPECSNIGLMAVANRCKLLRKLHIDGWRINRISDEGLIAIAKQCGNLLELVLIGVNSTVLSLEAIGCNCPKLERLALCGSDTIGNAEISCIAANCMALKKLCIKGCPVSDYGMEALARGCPNLIKVKIKKCTGVTSVMADWLRTQRGSLAVNFDSCESEVIDASMSDGGGQEDIQELPPLEQLEVGSDALAGSNGRRAFFKGKFGLFADDGHMMGASVCDPSRRPKETLLFGAVIKCQSNRKMVMEFEMNSPDCVSPEQLDWEITEVTEKSLRSNAMISVDCEMVICEDGSEGLVRVCVVELCISAIYVAVLLSFLLNSSSKAVLGYELRKDGAPHGCLDDACAAMKRVLVKIEQGYDKLIPFIPKEAHTNTGFAVVHNETNVREYKKIQLQVNVLKFAVK
ncbi:Leucine-rich repeat [Dillenia turbinata]|uniref:Leucine-rich repeat n=1 Tax=Dillenia turbinata TaxID=194707 RepID=A0AAN8Z679_9MAGN